MLDVRYQKGVEHGLIGERSKTIILLRVTPGAEPAPLGVAKLTGEGFAGEPPQLFIVSQRTQQNDRGFVAFGGVIGI